MNFPSKNFSIKSLLSFLLLGISLSFFSCATLYDHYTFTETVETKVQVQNLIEQSATPYAENKSQINTFQNQLQKMLIYERAKGKNEITLKMWEFINNPNSSINKFLALWEEQNTLSPAFIEEFRAPITRIFDLMVAYENNKDKPTENALLQVLQTQ